MDVAAELPDLMAAERPVEVGEGEVLDRRTGKVGRRLEKPPFRNDLGRVIYENVSAESWREWIGMGTKVINELRLPLSDPQAQKVFRPAHGGVPEPARRGGKSRVGRCPTLRGGCGRGCGHHRLLHAQPGGEDDREAVLGYGLDRAGERRVGLLGPRVPRCGAESVDPGVEVLLLAAESQHVALQIVIRRRQRRGEGPGRRACARRCRPPSAASSAGSPPSPPNCGSASPRSNRSRVAGRPAGHRFWPAPRRSPCSTPPSPRMSPTASAPGPRVGGRGRHPAGRSGRRGRGPAAGRARPAAAVPAPPPPRRANWRFTGAAARASSKVFRRPHPLVLPQVDHAEVEQRRGVGAGRGSSTFSSVARAWGNWPACSSITPCR